MTNQYAFGIDVGGTTVKLGLFTAAGVLLEKWEIPTRTQEGGRFILPDIASAIRQKISSLPWRSAILGVGIGVPGPVQKNGVVNRCVNLGWGVFNVADSLSFLLDGLTVRAANDANTAALGEMWQGGGKGCSNVVMVTLGTGVGGGVILDGQILPGSFGAAGELGHMMVHPQEPEVCSCGKHGCLEQYASATGIVRLARQALEQDDSPSLLRQAPELTAKAVCDCARERDPLSLSVLEQVGEMLGRALSLTAAVCDPDVFVIGGGVSRAGEILLDPIRRHYRESVFHASRETPIVPAVLGNDAGIWGSVKLVLS
jgi:glucokinase